MPTGSALLLEDPSGGPDVPASVFPASSRWTDGLATLVLGARANRAPEHGRLGALFKLTDAEARLLCALVAGERIADYAVRTKVSLATAKTHLGALFNKTGERRQSDLIRRALSDPLLFSQT